MGVGPGVDAPVQHDSFGLPGRQLRRRVPTLDVVAEEGAQAVTGVGPGQQYVREVVHGPMAAGVAGVFVRLSCRSSRIEARR